MNLYLTEQILRLQIFHSLQVHTPRPSIPFLPTRDKLSVVIRCTVVILDVVRWCAESLGYLQQENTKSRLISRFR